MATKKKSAAKKKQAPAAPKKKTAPKKQTVAKKPAAPRKKVAPKKPAVAKKPAARKQAPKMPKAGATVIVEHAGQHHEAIVVETVAALKVRIKDAQGTEVIVTEYKVKPD